MPVGSKSLFTLVCMAVVFGSWYLNSEIHGIPIKTIIGGIPFPSIKNLLVRQEQEQLRLPKVALISRVTVRYNAVTSI